MTFYQVSNEEVWRELQEAKHDIQQMQSDFAFLKQHGEDREKRIRKLEFRYYAILASVGLAAFTSAVIQRVLS